MASLDRRTVVVTRGKGGEDALSARLRALGAEVREVPSIAFADPADPAPLDAALRALDGFEWAVFTSATGVDRTVARLRALGLDVAALARLALAAVGPATAERLARDRARAGPRSGRGEGRRARARRSRRTCAAGACSSLVPPRDGPRRWPGSSPPAPS